VVGQIAATQREELARLNQGEILSGKGFPLLLLDASSAHTAGAADKSDLQPSGPAVASSGAVEAKRSSRKEARSNTTQPVLPLHVEVRRRRGIAVKLGALGDSSRLPDR